MNDFASLTIETARLWLRPMQADDFDALLQIFTDPKVMASFDAELFTPAQMQGWLNRNLEHQAQVGYGLFAVIRKPDERLIGDCGLEQMTIDGQAAAELGYDFRSDVWNQGFATTPRRCWRTCAGAGRCSPNSSHGSRRRATSSYTTAISAKRSASSGRTPTTPAGAISIGCGCHRFAAAGCGARRKGSA